MIKIEKTEVWGFEHAIRGMRNPMNSWERSDTSFYCYPKEGVQHLLGENDRQLMEKLIRGGQPHRKFLRQIFVSVDITAPLYWWSEFDTYKVGTTANSCSKMHTLLSRPFEMSDFSFDKLIGYRNEISQYVPVLDEEEIAGEIWLPCDTDYEVSNLGRIRHLFPAHYRLLGGSLHEDGYIFVTMHGKQIPVHRVVADHFCCSKENGKVVNHKDGNKQNNRADNLEWITQKENVKHSVENHFRSNAVNTYKGKFSESERQSIKELWNNGELSKRKIAEKYGVSHTCINDIISDKYKYCEKVNIYAEVARPLVDTLNELRDSYFRCEDDTVKKGIWYSILQLLPSSYNQKRTVTMTYENLLNMLEYRRGHKLDEWREFCDWIISLPYGELLKEGLV